MITPTLNELQTKNKKSYTIYTELFSDFHTPISVIYKLKQKSKKCFLLESVTGSENWGRYSFIGFEPKETLVAKNSKIYIDDVLVEKDIIEVIIERLSIYSNSDNDNLPPFTGGYVGYFAYDSISYFEEAIKMTSDKVIDNNDIELQLYDTIIAFDHLKKKIFIIKNILSDSLEKNYKQGVLEINAIKEILNETVIFKDNKVEIGEFSSNHTMEEFCNNVTTAKHHIKEGDVFQVVLSQRFSADIKGDLFNTYRMLRTINPSPYMFYFISNDLEIAGASPETLVHVVKDKVKTFPIAGTRRRGIDREEDNALEKELLADEKELAEHNMLVDLGRNDCGKVCEFGTVQVKNYKKINRFSKVMHITSEVEGTLRKELTSLDALKAIIPAGTLSGAPKIMACNLIDKYEPSKRGLYGGAIGYINFDLDMDMCITIRTAIKLDNQVHVQAGGGIVMDSDEVSEYNESVFKASAMIQAIKTANKVGE